MPTAVNYYLVGESLYYSFLIGVLGEPAIISFANTANNYSLLLVRACVAIQSTAFVNSAAHMFGDKPYNSAISSSENSIVAYGCVGEGYHNYHHAYPWDYGIGEQGNWFNLGKAFIDIMFMTGQAYDLKQASPDMISKSRAKASAKACDLEENY